MSVAMLTTSLLLITLAQYDYDQRQYENQQYRYQAQQQAAQDNFAAQSKLRALQYKAQLDAVNAPTAAGTTAKKKKAPLECRAVEFGELKPLGGRFDEHRDVLTVFLEETGGALFTFKVKFDGPARTQVTGARLALESSSGLQFVSVGWKHGETGHAARRFKATLLNVTLHSAASVFEPSPTPRDCVVIARVAIDVPWYD